MINKSRINNFAQKVKLLHYRYSTILIVPLFWIILLAFADFIIWANEIRELSIIKGVIYFNIMSFFLLLIWIYLCMHNLLQKIINITFHKSNESSTNHKITENE